MWTGHEIDAAIAAHTSLVRTLAWFASTRLPASVEHDDLFQAGMIGLLDAATRFDPGQGVEFRTFATPRIRGAFLDELREMDWLPRSIRRAQRSIDAAIREVEKQTGRAAREREVAETMGLTLEAYQRLVAEATAPGVIEIDAQHKGDEAFLDRNLPDPAAGPLERYAEKRLNTAVLQEMRKLSERQLVFMRMRYDRDLSFPEIAQHFGVTESRACQMHAEIVIALRRGLQAYGAPAPPPTLKKQGRPRASR